MGAEDENIFFNRKRKVPENVQSLRLLPIPGLSNCYFGYKNRDFGEFIWGIVIFVIVTSGILIFKSFLDGVDFSSDFYYWATVGMIGVPVGIFIWKICYDSWAEGEPYSHDSGVDNIIVKNVMSEDALAILSRETNKLVPMRGAYIPAGSERHFHFVHAFPIDLYVMWGTDWDKEKMHFNNPCRIYSYFKVGENCIKSNWIHMMPGYGADHYNYFVNLTIDGSNKILKESDFSSIFDCDYHIRS
jgi:hypothetical protein